MEARYAITVNASEDTVRRMWDDVDLDGSPLQTSGRVRFARAPGGRGTEVHAEADYTMPGGTMGSAVAKVGGARATDQRRASHVQTSGRDRRVGALAAAVTR
jgi:uncharacterized membrane protein